MPHQPTRIRPLLALLMLATAVLTATMLAPRPLAAQDGTGPTLQPYIVTLTLTPNRALTVAEVEAEDISATLSWQVRNLQDGQQLELQTFRRNGWEPLPPADRSLRPDDSFTTIVRHTGTFAPPAYRLRILDGQVVRDERVVTLRYTAAQFPPRIERFSADTGTLNEDALAAGNARLSVSWEVLNRAPTSNLVFEQVLPGDEVVSVELPRDFAWVASVGEGAVAPVAVPEGEPLRLRLRVVDLRDETVLSERLLTIPLGAAAAATPVVNNFDATPTSIEREGEVGLTWSVSGAAVVNVGRVSAVGQFVRDAEDLPATGSLTLNALPDSFYVQEFFLYAGDADGNGITERVSVSIACPYTFFMEFSVSPELCPLDEPAEFMGAYQLFDRGEMLWRSDRNTIIVLYNDGTYARFQDTFTEGEEIDYPDAVADVELSDENALPIRGFGKVWAQNQTVRDGLGFAIGEELGYTMQGQDVAAGDLDRDFSTAYITLPDSSVVELATDGTWRKPGDEDR